MADILNAFGFHSWKWAKFITPLDKKFPWFPGLRNANNIITEEDQDNQLDLNKKRIIFEKLKRQGKHLNYLNLTEDHEENVRIVAHFLKFRTHPHNENLWCFSLRKGGGISKCFKSRRKVVEWLLKHHRYDMTALACFKKWPPYNPPSILLEIQSVDTSTEESEEDRTDEMDMDENEIIDLTGESLHGDEEIFSEDENYNQEESAEGDGESLEED